MTKVIEKAKKLFGLDSRGREVLDNTPVVVNTGLNRPLTLEERVRQAVRSEEWVRFHAAQGRVVGSFEEEDDFDMPDVEDFSSPYEEHFDHDANIQQLNAEIKERRRKAAMKPAKKSSVTEEKVAEPEAEA